MINILFLADIFGKPGRKIVASLLPNLKEENQIDVVIANGENAAGGLGINLKTADEIFKAGVDIITTGNHIWDKREIIAYLNSNKKIIRPANFPDPAPGNGYIIFEIQDGINIAVINLMGRVGMKELLDCPFKKADQVINDIKKQADIVIVDFHAEASSEKVALGHYLDGRVNLIVGTHTHIQTADDRILKKGSAYLTDAGMCGPQNGVIGAAKEHIIEKFLTSRPTKFEIEKGEVQLNGVIVSVEKDNAQKLFQTKNIKRINLQNLKL